MDARIGYYKDGVRVLPKLTLSGKPVARPVLNTITLGSGHFAVLDLFPPKFFDVETEANKLRQSLGTPIQPRVGEDGVPVIDVGTPMFPPSGEIFTTQDDDSSTKGRK